jgi:hypothetical protein
MCGDSANASDVSALTNGKTARLCATDPPYLVSYDAKNRPSKGFSDGKNKDRKGRYADKPKGEPLGPFYEAFLRQALAVCKNDAAIYVWHASQQDLHSRPHAVDVAPTPGKSHYRTCPACALIVPLSTRLAIRMIDRPACPEPSLLRTV